MIGPAQVPELNGCGPSNGSFKAVDSRVADIENSSGEGFISATFDDVLINGSPYDDFSETRLNPDRWMNLDLVRRIEPDGPNNNILRLEQCRDGSDSSFNHLFANPNSIDSIRADVRIDSTELQDTNNNNARVLTRIFGYFFNDGSSTGPNDLTGNFRAQLVLRETFAGAHEVICNGRRSNDPAFGTFTTVFTQNFANWIEGQVHKATLSFDRASNTFLCQFDNDTYEYTLTNTDPQPVGDAVAPFKALATRVDNLNSADEQGCISVAYDNVEVNLHILFVDGFE